MSQNVRAFLFVNLACLCWAGNLVAGRMFRGDIGPGALVCLRTLIAASLFFVLVRMLKTARSGPRGDSSRGPGQGGLLLLMAASGIVGYQGLLYQGLHTTGALNAALINACCPLSTALLAWMVHGTQLRARQYLGILVSIVGVMVILCGGDLQQLIHLQFGIGDVLILCAVLLWGVYSLAARKIMTTYSVVDATAIATAIALPLSMPWALLEVWRGPAISWSVGLVSGLFYVGLFASVIAMLCWNRAVSLAGPEHAAASLNMIPLYALVVSVTLLNEPLHEHQIGGGLLVIGGCLLAVLVPRRLPRSSEAVSQVAIAESRNGIASR